MILRRPFMACPEKHAFFNGTKILRVAKNDLFIGIFMIAFTIYLPFRRTMVNYSREKALSLVMKGVSRNNNMKLQGKIITAVLGAALVGGGLTAAFAIGAKSEKIIEPAIATNSSTSFIYFDKNAYASDSTWVNQTPYLRYWTGSADGTIAMSKSNGNDQFWYGTLSSAGMSSSGGFCVRAADSGSNDYKETKWISWSTWTSSDNNLISLSGSNDSSDSYKANYSSSVLSGSELSSTCGGTVEYSDSLVPSYKTQRIWVRSSADFWYTSGARTAIRTWITSGETTSVVIYKTNSLLNSLNNLYYWYADIPAGITGYQFVRLNNGFDSVWNYSVNCASTANYLVHFILSTTTGSDQNVSTGIIDGAYLNGTTAAKFIEGYTTCSNSSVNGYGAVTNISTNWIANLSSDQLTAFNAASIADYPYADYQTAGGYTDGQSKSATTTGAEKWARMQAEFSSHSGAAKVSSGLSAKDSSITLAAVGALSLLGVAGFFLLKKKRVA